MFLLSVGWFLILSFIVYKSRAKQAPSEVGGKTVLNSATIWYPKQLPKYVQQRIHYLKFKEFSEGSNNINC